MRKTIFLLTALSLVLIWAATPAVAEEEAEGQAIFMASKCNICHGIESLEIEPKSTKIQGGDLSDTGNAHDAEWLAQFLKKEVDLEGDKHKSTWKGTDEDLGKLADWLASLKKAEG